MSRKTKRDIALVIDLEATCWEDKAPEGMVSEIIEIGISAIDYVTKEVRLRDTIIVKPKQSTVSEFCTGLTTLTQEFVDENGISFEEACEIIKTKYKSKDRIWMSWGEYDKNQFERDCKLKNVKYPFGRTHINAKPLFSFANGLPYDLGVEGALDYLGLEFDGTSHRGGDDAYNIANIIRKTLLPLIGEEGYGVRVRKEHQLLDEHLQEKYKEEDLKGNVTRIITKNCPEAPDKSMR